MFNRSKKLQIAQVVTPEVPIPPPKYGGIERVVASLIARHSQGGHDVTLFGSKHSTVNARVIDTAPFDPYQEPEYFKLESALLRSSYQFFAAAKTARIINEQKYDIIHNHIGWQFLLNSGVFQTPVVTTIHGPLSLHKNDLLYQHFYQYPYVSISDNQRRLLPQMNFITTIYNGIDISTLEFNPTPEDYVVFLSRITPKKGVKEAIEFAKAAGVKLKIAGNVIPLDQEYFTKEIKPHIDGKTVEYVGEVDQKEKSDLLKNAKALIGLIQWEEPFGMFVVEAMACGTPVIGTKRGSLPEIILESETGYLVNDVKEAVQAWQHIDKISRKRCRSYVEEKFTDDRMAAAYEKLYQQIVRARRRNRITPWWK